MLPLSLFLLCDYRCVNSTLPASLTPLPPAPLPPVPPPPSLCSLEEWITSFRARHTQYQNWLNHRPTHFDIGLMFNAQGFLTAVLQEYGRNQTPRLSLNRVSADTKVCKTVR